MTAARAAPAARTAAPAEPTPGDHVSVETMQQRDGEPGQARARRRWPWVVAGVALLLVGGYAATAWAVSGRVPSGTTVDGVAVDGLSRDEAVARVEAAVGPGVGEPVPVVVGDAADALDPATSGLDLDVAGAVDSVIGFSLDPRDLWRHVGGRAEVESEPTVDDEELAAAVGELADRVAGEPVEGAVAFADGQVVATPATQGRALDVEAAAALVAEQWWTGPQPLTLPAAISEPDVDQADVDEALASFARPATAGPLFVEVARGGAATAGAELPPTVVTTALRMDAVDGRLVPVVDGEVLKAAVLQAAPQVATAPRNATIGFEGDRPVVVPGADGVTLDAAALAGSVQAALVTPERRAVVEAVVAEPEVTTAEAEALGVTGVVSEFSTNLTPDAGRTENITIASGTVNGTLLLPGETFSLNDSLGRRTEAKGYNEAPVIVGGRLTRDFGGGVSQVATTLFNGMFFAGLEDVEHQPHSFYISRYPEGREATVNFGSIDLRFTNDSPHGVYIQMFTGGGQVTTRFWSTKVWDIATEKGPRRNVREPGSVTDSGPDCIAQAPQSGFDVTVTRTFSQSGSRVRSEEFNTRYNAEDRVTCT